MYLTFVPVCLCSQVPGCTSASNECERTSGGSEPCCVTCCSTSTTAERASSGSASRLQCECVIVGLLKSRSPETLTRIITQPEKEDACAHFSFNWKISGILNCFICRGGLFFWGGNQALLITVVESDELVLEIRQRAQMVVTPLLFLSAFHLQGSPQ